ncbi:hypothetical protein OXYTRIMIC_355 [Oxytricha trifallax]|uniref:Uncharacterized protein n=1 Tax=Oxytricha trifallax TaxID=1172189 RepID=A0A073HZ23_9SPIT|nr:hypothetical protein OXYTRIMIC_355 [Oxytricha trifallax]
MRRKGPHPNILITAAANHILVGESPTDRSLGMEHTHRIEIHVVIFDKETVSNDKKMTKLHGYHKSSAAVQNDPKIIWPSLAIPIGLLTNKSYNKRVQPFECKTLFLWSSLNLKCKDLFHLIRLSQQQNLEHQEGHQLDSYMGRKRKTYRSLNFQRFLSNYLRQLPQEFSTFLIVKPFILTEVDQIYEKPKPYQQHQGVERSPLEESGIIQACNNLLVKSASTIMQQQVDMCKGACTKKIGWPGKTRCLFISSSQSSSLSQTFHRRETAFGESNSGIGWFPRQQKIGFSFEILKFYKCRKFKCRSVDILGDGEEDEDDDEEQDNQDDEEDIEDGEDLDESEREQVQNKRMSQRVITARRKKKFEVNYTVGMIEDENASHLSSQSTTSQTFH